MSTETLVALPETKPAGSEPASEGVRGMAAKFMEARNADNSPEKKEEAKPVLVEKSAVDRILAPPKKEEAPPADPLDEFKDDKKAAANIPKMRESYETQIKKLRTEVEEAKKIVAPAKDQEELKTRLEALQKERDQLAETVKLGNPEKSEEYQAMTSERSKHIEKMTARLTDFGGDTDKFKEALALTGKAKIEALKGAMRDLDVDDRTVVRLMVEDLEKLDEKRKDFLSDADKTWSAKQQERTAKEREMSETKAKELVGEIQNLKKTLPDEFFMLKDADESPEWNELNAKAFTEAEAMAKGQRPRNEVLRTLAMGLRAGHLAELFKAERDARLKAEERLARRGSAGPDIRGNGAPPKTSGEHKSPGSRFAELLAPGGMQGD